MRILSFQNPESLALQTEVLLRELREKKQNRLRGFFPTGRTPEEFYRLLRNKSLVWKNAFEPIQIDEFAGQKRLFHDTLKAQLIDPLSLQGQFECIDPSWTEESMKIHIQKVLSQPIDFCLLGLGPNGHIGFHEPFGGDQSYLGGRVLLSEQSFSRVTGAPGRWALTFGAGSFLRAQKIILLVTGDNKREVFEKFKTAEPSSEIPVTLLKGHPDLTVLTTLDDANAGHSQSL